MPWNVDGAPKVWISPRTWSISNRGERNGANLYFAVILSALKTISLMGYHASGDLSASTVSVGTFTSPLEPMMCT